MTPEQRIEKLEAIVAQLLKSDRYSFEKHLQVLDGRNVQVGKTNGTKVATAADQKLGFFGATPKVQPTADTVNAATNIYSTDFFADDSYGNNEKNMINNIWNALIGLGLISEI